MESRLVFGDFTRSRLVDLLDDRDPTQANSYRYADKSFEDYQRHFLSNTPYAEHKRLSLKMHTDDDEASIMAAARDAQNKVSKTITEALKIPKDHKQRSIVTFVKGSDEPNVKYAPARMVNQHGKPSLVPPMLQFKVPACEKNSVQRLNSGYIIDISSRVRYKLVNNQLVPISKSIEQDPFLLLPRFICDDPTVVPQPILIDRADKNIFFLIVYNPLGVACTVTVFFHSFLFEQDVLSAIRMVDGDDRTVILKPKDSNNLGCGVFNLKAKVMYDKLERSARDNMLLVAPLFDASKETASPTGARISFERHNFFFSPRRRNWFDDHLLAMPGFFSRDGLTFLPPTLRAGSVYNNNTHCVSLLLKRTVLFSVTDKLNASHVVLNGAFANLKNYKTLYENMRKISHLIERLTMDRHEESYFKRIHTNYANLNLSLLTDYECSLTESPFFDKLVELLASYDADPKTCEEQIYNKRQKRAKSARLYSCMKYLHTYIYGKGNGNDDNCSSDTVSKEEEANDVKLDAEKEDKTETTTTTLSIDDEKDAESNKRKRTEHNDGKEECDVVSSSDLTNNECKRLKLSENSNVKVDQATVTSLAAATTTTATIEVTEELKDIPLPLQESSLSPLPMCTTSLDSTKED